MAESETTFGLINSQFDLCREYADDAYTKVEGFLDELENLVHEDIPAINDDWIEYDWPVPSLKDLPYIDRPDPPTDAQLEGDLIVLPAMPSIDPIELPEIPEIPIITIVPPQVDMPEPPSTVLPDAPGDPPSMNYPDMPVKPQYTIPDFPEISLPAIPSMPVVNLPHFEGELPVISLSPLENTFIYSEAVYQSETLDALKTALRTYAEDGKTGLPDEVVEAIWNQAKLRTESENEKIYEEALNFWAARGFNLPPGMLASRLSEARTEIARANADINEKLTIEQAKLAQENTQFVLKTITDLEGLLMNHTNQVATRALEAQKIAVQASVDVYNANIARYNLMLDTYKTSATVYEARIRGELLGLEAYKSQLEAVKVSGELQMFHVDIYKAKISGAATLIELYKSEVQAAALQLETDKLRLDGYKALVDVYATRVQAKTAEYGMYQAQLSGEESKVKLYSEQVRGYVGLLDGYKTRIEAIKTEAETKSIVNKSKIELYQSDVERYKADVGRVSSEVENIVKAYGLRTQVYDTDIKAATAELGAQIEAYRGRVQQAQNQTQLLLQQAEASLKAYLSNRELTVQISKDGANVAAQLAASALSAIHASASGSYSANASWDETKAVPTTSTAYEYIYNE